MPCTPSVVVDDKRCLSQGTWLGGKVEKNSRKEENVAGNRERLVKSRNGYDSPEGDCRLSSA